MRQGSATLLGAVYVTHAAYVIIYAERYTLTSFSLCCHCHADACFAIRAILPLASPLFHAAIDTGHAIPIFAMLLLMPFL